MDTISKRRGPVAHVDKRRLRVSGKVGAGSVPKDPLIVFAASACLFLAAAYILAFQVKYALGDAMSRTFSAFAAVHGVYPHLATIGFIWPPLPTFLQIPLIWIKPLAYYGFAGMIVSAFFGAGSLAALDMLYRHYGFKWWTRAILAALFVGNPYIMFYAANGMSEMAFVFFFSVALAGFAAWDRHNQWRMVTLMGIAVTGAFYVRYDALALALAFFIGIILMMPKLDADAPERIEGTLLAFSVLVGYGVAVWIFMNWSIMKDPLYFYRSEYSNLAITRSMRDTPQVQALQHSWIAVLQYGTEMMYRVSPLFTVLTPLLVLGSLIRRRAAVFVMVLISLSVPAFQVFMFRQGTTFGFDRFYISVIPATFILGVTVVDKIQRSNVRLKAFALPLLMMALAISTGWTAVRVYEGRSSTEEGTVMLASMEMRPLNTFALDEEVAHYILAHVSGRQVLADSNSADRIVLFTQEPRLFVLTADPDFDEVLRSPAGRVGYILAQNPESTFTFDAILDRYPNIWTGGVPFTELEKDFGRYRLYRIKT